MTSTPSPRPLIELGTAFWASKTLLSAVEIGLFTVLGEGPATEEQLRDRLQLHPRSSRDFLDSLVALDVLERQDGTYRNGPAAAAYLDESKDAYLGGWMRQASKHLFRAWGGLTDSLRSGTQHIGWNDQEYFRKLYEDLDERRSFIAAMDAMTNQIGPELASSMDWTDYDEFVDVGGARGNLAAIIAREHAHLRGTVLDMPQLKPLFEEHIGGELAGRVGFQTGDFFADVLPESDVLIFGHIMHDWDESQRRQLIAKAFDAVRPGGAVVIYDRMIDDERRQNAVCLLGSLNLLLVTPGGSEYTVADCRGWLTDAGFARTASLPLVQGLETAVIGRKAR